MILPNLPGTELRDLRMKLGLKQTELSALTKIPQPRISLYERGLAMRPEDKARLSRVLRLEHADDESS